MEIKSTIKKRGIIFALDAALAVTVVIIILINSSYYFSTSSKESLSQLQPVRIGSDVIALLDFGGNIQYAIQQDSDADPTIPSKNLNVTDYLPQNYAMRFGITDMKETPINKKYCKDSLVFCQTHSAVDCPSDNTGCILDKDEWIEVSPAVTSDGTNYAQDIKNRGEHFISIGIDKTSAGSKGSLALEINVNGNITPVIVTFDPERSGITIVYLWGIATLFPYFEPGSISNFNKITLTNREETLDPKIKWIRVVGDESYMRFAFSDPSLTSLPIDKFVGSGERFVVATDEYNDFDSYHLVRYWVWLNATVGG